MFTMSASWQNRKCGSHWWHMANFFQVKEFWKLVKIWESYCQKFGGFLFWDTVYIPDYKMLLSYLNFYSILIQFYEIILKLELPVSKLLPCPLELVIMMTESSQIRKQNIKFGVRSRHKNQLRGDVSKYGFRQSWQLRRMQMLHPVTTFNMLNTVTWRQNLTFWKKFAIKLVRAHGTLSASKYFHVLIKNRSTLFLIHIP